MGNENREQKGVMKFISAFNEREKGLIYPKENAFKKDEFHSILSLPYNIFNMLILSIGTY